MLGDPAIPRDNTYQVTLVIAGVTYVLDAGAIDKSVSKGQFINDGLTEMPSAASEGHPTVQSTALCTRSHPQGDGDELRARVLATKESIRKTDYGESVKGRRFV